MHVQRSFNSVRVLSPFGSSPEFAFCFRQNDSPDACTCQCLSWCWYFTVYVRTAPCVCVPVGFAGNVSNTLCAYEEWILCVGIALQCWPVSTLSERSDLPSRIIL